MKRVVPGKTAVSDQNTAASGPERCADLHEDYQRRPGFFGFPNLRNFKP